MKAFHRESLYVRGEPVPKIDCIDGLECYDISYFPWRRNLERIIRQFNPSLVIMLTHSFLFDRAIIRLCRRIGVRTIFLQHGVINFSLGGARLKLHLLPAMYLDKARRYLLYDLPIFFKVMAPEDPLCMLKPSFFQFLARRLILNYRFIPPHRASEVPADQALVYGEFYAEKLKRLHGYQDKQLHIVGNLTFDPLIDLAESGAGGRESWLSARGLDPTRKTVVYLPQPLVEGGYCSQSEFQKYLAMLADQLTEKELNLVIKLHPRNDVNLFSVALSNQYVAIEETDLAGSVYFSDAVVGQSSTALGLAIAAYKPLIIWSMSKGQSFFSGRLEELDSVAYVVESPEDLGLVLDAISSTDWACNVKLYNEWLQKYSYFKLEEKAVQRIAAALIAEYRKCDKKAIP